ncbi:MAG: ribosome silencing factor [Actinomycetota bacterium]|nr:ribosome silencing factor [Actinomycetota bacterium]
MTDVSERRARGHDLRAQLIVVVLAVVAGLITAALGAPVDAGVVDVDVEEAPAEPAAEPEAGGAGGQVTLIVGGTGDLARRSVARTTSGCRHRATRICRAVVNEHRERARVVAYGAARPDDRAGDHRAIDLRVAVLVERAGAALTYEALPVESFSIEGTVRYDVLADAADTLMRNALGFALLNGGDPRARVAVRDGTGAFGPAPLVAAVLVPAEGKITSTGNVQGFGVGVTQVVYQDDGDIAAAELRTTIRGVTTDARDKARIAATAADDKQATDIVVLDVGDILGIVDVFVIASAPNTRLVRTIVDAVQKHIRERTQTKARSVEGLDDASWVLVDYGDVVIHVFLEETREFYGLERLWADAERVPWEGAEAS